MVEHGVYKKDENSSRDYSGFAIVMNKILQTSKPRRKKTLVLAKAKKLSLKNATVELKSAKDDLLNNHQVKNSDWILKGRMKPDPVERNYEKRLLKVTTRGVVNLFNAVNKYKNKSLKSNQTIEDRNLKSIDKKKFLGILLNGRQASSNKESVENNEVQSKTDQDNKCLDSWDVLRKDFVEGTTWRNWDKSLSKYNE